MQEFASPFPRQDSTSMYGAWMTCKYLIKYLMTLTVMYAYIYVIYERQRQFAKDESPTFQLRVYKPTKTAAS